jgi:serine/threonine-protein kinase
MRADADEVNDFDASTCRSVRPRKREDTVMSTRLQPGDLCAGHHILQHLGTGGAAEVYAARLAGGELRAFKLMRVEGKLAPSLPGRFAQEAEALALIVHPSVVRFHDAGAFEDRVWLSLELVEGETLGHRLRTRGRPPLDELLHWLQQACEGLAEAHRVGVIHRDLTPENLLVMPGGAVKVIDFGMAKLRAFGVATTRELELGSARYRPPEQLRGEPAHARMDVYALGHILYEALAGEHAMGEAPRPMIDIVRWQLSGRPRPLGERAPELPADLADLIHRSLEKDPALRPPSMQALNAALREVRARLRAPQRRAARNVPLVERDPVHAPTVPMAAMSEAAMPATATPERPALLPAAPTLVSLRSAAPVAATIPMAAVSLAAPALEELRATDAPVELMANRPSLKPRRIPAAALVAGATALAAASWVLLGPVAGPTTEAARLPRAAAAAPAPGSAFPALSASASAQAPQAPGSSARPPVKGRLSGPR